MLVLSLFTSPDTYNIPLSTVITQDQGRLAEELITVLKDAGQQIPDELNQLVSGGGK